MKNRIHIKNISELSFLRQSDNDTNNGVNCITVDYQAISTQFSSAIYLDAFISILVLSGEGNVCINYKTYPIYTDTLLVLSSSHLFYFSECSNDFSCRCLFVSKEFTNEMDSTDMIYRRVKYGVRLYNTPVIRLNRSNAATLYKGISVIDKTLNNPRHFYYKEKVLNNIFNFYLDLSDIIERNVDFSTEGNLTRYESIIKSFIELLASYYREEHNVEFYASKLSMSPHYLTLIVKHVTGQSVSDFIFEMLYSEARNLLTHSKLSIQEIASKLNFSDQSSFGKFFKRKAGVSPIDFRRES